MEHGLGITCKQKPSYELRISNWSSDVFSSDLHGSPPAPKAAAHAAIAEDHDEDDRHDDDPEEPGRARAPIALRQKPCGFGVPGLRLFIGELELRDQRVRARQDSFRHPAFTAIRQYRLLNDDA